MHHCIISSPKLRHDCVHSLCLEYIPCSTVLIESLFNVEHTAPRLLNHVSSNPCRRRVAATYLAYKWLENYSKVATFLTFEWAFVAFYGQIVLKLVKSTIFLAILKFSLKEKKTEVRLDRRHTHTHRHTLTHVTVTNSFII